jgi:hypothetical protein
MKVYFRHFAPETGLGSACPPMAVRSGPVCGVAAGAVNEAQ